MLTSTDGIWYRAVARGKKDTDYKMFFIDFGNMSVVNHSCVRSFTQELASFPSKAVRCQLSGK